MSKIIARNAASVLAVATLLSLACLPSHAAEATPWSARAVVNKAKAEAVKIPAQAEALVRLAWPAGEPSHPEVAALARKELVDFGTHSLRALRFAVRRVPARYQADATATFIEAGLRVVGSKSPDYLPGLEEAIWFGSMEAKRLAMLEITRHRFPPALLSIIDAICEYPDLTDVGLATLGRLRDDRSRSFLTDVMMLGPDRFRAPAAVALTGAGELAMQTLRKEARSDDTALRRAAIEGVLVVAGIDDLTLLHEYYGLRQDDAPELLERVRAKASELEVELQKGVDMIERMESEGNESEGNQSED